MFLNDPIFGKSPMDLLKQVICTIFVTISHLHRWCSGIMQDSHSCDPGSIPGRSAEICSGEHPKYLHFYVRTSTSAAANIQSIYTTTSALQHLQRRTSKVSTLLRPHFYICSGEHPKYLHFYVRTSTSAAANIQSIYTTTSALQHLQRRTSKVSTLLRPHFYICSGEHPKYLHYYVRTSTSAAANIQSIYTTTSALQHLQRRTSKVSTLLRPHFYICSGEHPKYLHFYVRTSTSAAANIQSIYTTTSALQHLQRRTSKVSTLLRPHFYICSGEHPKYLHYYVRTSTSAAANIQSIYTSTSAR
ncbi:hypothetical protein J6590_017191, partial [Homalodisca vitripennis]